MIDDEFDVKARAGCSLSVWNYREQKTNGSIGVHFLR